MQKINKECLVCIKKTFKKFLSILVIVLLGVGFFAGIKATSPDMQKTLDKYYKETNFYDISLISTYGITKEDINYLKNKNFNIEGSYSFDAIVKKDEEYAVKVISYNENLNINKIKLIEGSLPKNDNECIIEKNIKGYKIGDSILIENDNLKEKELKIVGIIESPLYISRERGTTSLLNGTLNFYVYVPVTNFNNEYYTEAYIDINTSESVFSKKYENKIEKEIENLEEISNFLSNRRYTEVFNEANKELNKAKEEYNNKKEEANAYLNSSYISDDNKAKIRQSLSEAEEKLNVITEEIKNIEKPKWYILDINSNIGFNNYSQDSNRIKNVAKLFPIVFFVVAILICLTTMTRMVEEERIQIGTLKSLGYTDKSIMSKYLLYAFLATLFGSILGVVIGFNLIPEIIFNMYSMMYTISDFQNNFNILLTLEGSLIAIVCTLGATYYTAYKTLKEAPAELLRPKSPDPGKKVLLEKIPFIWKHIKFSKKVTIRNVFRYKKRFLMTIIGISGCTSLILAGFGIKDCITNMVPNQYEKIFNYEVEVVLKNDITLNEKNNTFESIKSMEEVNNLLKIQKQGIEIDGETEPVQLIVPFDDISDFITLQNRTTNKKYELNKGIIITEKLSKLLNLKKGNTLILKDDKNKNYEVKINNITKNYLMHYIYMSKETYNSNEYNTILLKTQKMTNKEEKEFSNKLKDLGTISSLSFNSSVKNIFNDSMKNFRYVSLILIISAGLLAFVVLYSLESVNISERKRELASLKVLGFYDKEVYNYISRETIILTVIGMILGLGMGIVLTDFILKTCELNITMFGSKINYISYIYALLITIIFTIIVNITTYFSLKRINMIESLKSVE